MLNGSYSRIICVSVVILKSKTRADYKIMGLGGLMVAELGLIVFYSPFNAEAIINSLIKHTIRS